jgi:hypothetical protein
MSAKTRATRCRRRVRGRGIVIVDSMQATSKVDKCKLLPMKGFSAALGPREKCEDPLSPPPLAIS